MTKTIMTYEERAISDIIIAEDRKRDLGDIESLASDIARVGLLQPIVITHEGVLAAGERRLTACKSLSWDRIPVAVMPPGLGADNLVIVELLENISRKDFEWHEELALKLKLHKIWIDEAKSANSKPWGYRDSAKKFGVSLGGFSTDLEIAKAIEVFPDLKKCASKGKAREAYKKISKQAAAIEAMKSIPTEQAERLQAMMSGNMDEALSQDVIAAIEERTLPSTLPKVIHDASSVVLPGSERSEIEHVEESAEPQLPKHLYAVQPYADFLPQIPNNSVGLIELDPPYAIDFENTYGKKDKIVSAATDWTVDQLYEFYIDFLPVLFDKLLDDSWMIVWTGKEHAQWTMKCATEAGFQCQSPGVWVKPGGSTNTPRTTMTSCYETFILMRKGEATFNVPSVKNVWEFNSVAATQKIHQWEKPFEMGRYITKIMGRQDTIFLSPFAGSGNTLIAAALEGMIPMGCDKSDKYLPLFYETFKNYFI